jgi:hypothetical protein
MPRRRRPPTTPMTPIPVVLPLSEPTILAAANWVRDTTLLYGGSISTAYTVAGIFARGLERELAARRDRPTGGQA